MSFRVNSLKHLARYRPPSCPCSVSTSSTPRLVFRALPRCTDQGPMPPLPHRAPSARQHPPPQNPRAPARRIGTGSCCRLAQHVA